MKKEQFSYGSANLVKIGYRQARWALAREWLRLHPDVDVVGITGSVGKTTAKEVIASVLSQRFGVLKTAKNLEPMFNLPLTALKARGKEKLVAEMGVDGFGQMDRYLDLVKPRVALLTRLSPAHTDREHFGSLKGLIKEKSKLIFSLPAHGWALLNGDDQRVRELTHEVKSNLLLFGFSKDCDLRLSNFKQAIRNGQPATSFSLDYGFDQEDFEFGLFGKHNALIATAAVGVGMIMGIDFEEIKQGLLAVEPITGRLDLKKGKKGWVIDDSYNASPEAVKAAVDVLKDLGGNNVLVLGDMLELGASAGELHYQVGGYVAKVGVGTLLAMGNHADPVLKGYLENGGKEDSALKMENHQEIGKHLKKTSWDIVLVKGSRGMKMEKVVEMVVSN